MYPRFIYTGFRTWQMDSTYSETYNLEEITMTLPNILSKLFPDYKVEFNFVRRSPLNQEEPNFIHTDEMMGDITCILYLNEMCPVDDGTTIYDNDNNPLVVVYSKFNRMIAFNSDLPHSRNLFENFGEGESARLIQVAFLKYKK